MPDRAAGSPATTLAINYDEEFFQELSGFFEILAHPLRLMILKIIEREEKDIRQIAQEAGANYDNTKKHLYRLLSIGLVQREAGFGEPTARGVYPVWKFSLVPHAMERVMQALAVFRAIRPGIGDPAVRVRLDALEKEIGRSVGETDAALMVLTGPEKGRVIPLSGARIPIGRADSSSGEATTPPSRIALSPAHASVTRVTHPHAEIFRESDRWFVRDCQSTSGTSVNGIPLSGGNAEVLAGGEILELGKGPTSVWLVFVRAGSGV